MKKSSEKIEEIDARMKRLFELISVTRQFGEWEVNESEFSEEENAVILRGEEIVKKHGFNEIHLLPKAVFTKLSEKEQEFIFQALETYVGHMKYSYHGGLKLKIADTKKQE